MTEAPMDWGWIDNNLDAHVRGGRIYIGLTPEVYRTLRRYMGKNKEAIRNRLLNSVGLEDAARLWEEEE